MVSRKPLPDNASVNTNTPPPAVSIQGVRQELWSASDSEPDPERVWARENSVPTQHSGTDATENKSGLSNVSGVSDVPDALQPGTSSKTLGYYQEEGNPWDEPDEKSGVETTATEPKSKLDEMPKALWPGGAKFETNPFKRKPVQTGSTDQINQDTQEPPTVPTNPPPPPPPSVPTVAFSQLDISEPETSTNPWQPAFTETRSSSTAPPLSDQEPKSNVWDSGLPLKVPSAGQVSNPPTVSPLSVEGEPQAWSNTSPNPPLQHPPERSQDAGEIFDDQNAWDDIGSNNKGKQPDLQTSQVQTETVDGWNLIDHEPMPEPVPGTLSKRSTWENFMDADDERPKDTTEPITTTEEPAPSLPPRRATEEQAPLQPPRPQALDGTNKSETYQIKNIHWFDATAAKNPRRSPILVQNANGPCPLVALVNALTLTTPATQKNSNLIETLKSREQISLDFLLEAVFDELMTHRHPESLPDMSELYVFLKGLHTGMNVNPRFIPTPDTVATQPSAPEALIPGTFESTRDMKLYATFAIPLIHGWLPPRNDPVYDSFSRQASSYDDVQSILFREEELEDKLSNSETGLTEQEQQLYQDIIIIKSFLATYATQLTPWGLDVITKAIRPGTVSILFRNDHFSTLYRHPQTLKLFTLVTDAGYYTHDEVVWESLADVRGERTEFFSGDFRIVGGPQNQRPSGNVPGSWYNDEGSSSNTNDGAWQTVQNRRGRNNRQNESSTSAPSQKHEQEDRDLALALQLQEEEEERHRTEQAARRRESQLSEQFIEQQGRQGTPARGAHGRGGSISRGGANGSGPLPPARGSSANQSTSTLASRGRPPVQQVRSLIPPATGTTTHRPTNDTVDDAPPSYEQASKSTPYVPPAGHPSHPDSSPSSATPRRRSILGGGRQDSNAGPSTPARGRQTTPAVSATGGATQGRDKDCVVM
ncbi:uncharacterized protein F4822DRAFT_266126 [Hypoxylon trugodes]|uniref:uncharacterized protein n=1 Tax=Hypoxylon trugodes TaxID=326681 RepID=UPI00219946C1|nr:uncharacterized protein F4822DRAFT_266126 [Hypoxylon trugodes]KAI1389014.1 hypothetical protein F4822DRAFT_266126 [Hypoxylon trugodes]